MVSSQPTGAALSANSGKGSGVGGQVAGTVGITPNQAGASQTTTTPISNSSGVNAGGQGTAKGPSQPIVSANISAAGKTASNKEGFTGITSNLEGTAKGAVNLAAGTAKELAADGSAIAKDITEAMKDAAKGTNKFATQVASAVSSNGPGKVQPSNGISGSGVAPASSSNQLSGSTKPQSQTGSAANQLSGGSKPQSQTTGTQKLPSQAGVSTGNGSKGTNGISAGASASGNGAGFGFGFNNSGGKNSFTSVSRNPTSGSSPQFMPIQFPPLDYSNPATTGQIGRQSGRRGDGGFYMPHLHTQGSFDFGGNNRNGVPFGLPAGVFQAELE